MRCFCGYIYQHHVTVRNGPAFSVYISKFFVASERIVAPQCVPSIYTAFAAISRSGILVKNAGVHPAKVLSRKRFSSLCPSAFQNISSGFGFHPLSETMDFFTLPLLRL